MNEFTELSISTNEKFQITITEYSQKTKIEFIHRVAIKKSFSQCCALNQGTQMVAL